MQLWHVREKVHHAAKNVAIEDSRSWMDGKRGQNAHVNGNRENRQRVRPKLCGPHAPFNEAEGVYQRQPAEELCERRECEFFSTAFPPNFTCHNDPAAHSSRAALDIGAFRIDGPRRFCIVLFSLVLSTLLPGLSRLQTSRSINSLSLTLLTFPFFFLSFSFLLFFRIFSNLIFEKNQKSKLKLNECGGGSVGSVGDILLMMMSSRKRRRQGADHGASYGADYGSNDGLTTTTTTGPRRVL